jgi:plastocyanin
MRFAFTSATLAALATVASAVQTQVIVGGGPLTFTPNQVTAAVGDTIQFVFMAKNHTATQSTFATPCQPLPNGLDSGFVPVAANATSTQAFVVTVNATDPMWFFCRQVGHCANGMVFAINPTANKTFAAFQAAANASGTTTSASPSASSGSSGTASTAGTGSTAETGTGAASSPSSTSTSKPNGALTVGAHAGGLLTVVGFVAGILL